MSDYATARLNMVESQVRPNRVTDLRVLEAMAELPRELFVPERLRGVAYVDEDIPVGAGRFLMEPMVLARLLQAAEVQPGDNALVVAAGAGYGAAVMSRLAARVVAVESDPALVRIAEAALRGLGAANVSLMTGAPALGHAAKAPYDVILVEGGAQHAPAALTDQLAEGGRMVVVLTPAGEQGRATLITKFGGVLSRRAIFDAGTPVLPEFRREPGFVF
jgi:protein-L-isoaspartate(D-aspartate) O-methyltransferase